MSWAAKASPAETNDFHSSLIRCAVTSTVLLSTRRASPSERSSTTRALASPAAAPPSASAGRFTTARNRRLRGPGLAFAPAPQARIVGALERASTDIEFVHLDGAIELMLTAHQQPQSVPHAPGGRLANTDRFGQAHR